MDLCPDSLYGWRIDYFGGPSPDWFGSFSLATGRSILRCRINKRLASEDASYSKLDSLKPLKVQIFLAMTCTWASVMSGNMGSERTFPANRIVALFLAVGDLLAVVDIAPLSPMAPKFLVG